MLNEKQAVALLFTAKSFNFQGTDSNVHTFYEMYKVNLDILNDVCEKKITKSEITNLDHDLN